MAFSLSEFWSSIPQPLRRVMGIRFDKTPIQTVDKLCEFVHTRAAYVAQTSLYGYLKTRMGTRYRQVFEDDKFLPSINNAKWRTYAACLADLSVFVAAVAGTEKRLADKQISALAQHCFDTAVATTFDDNDAAAVRAGAVQTFSDRLETTHWPNAAIGATAFSASPEELIASAPIADELKQHDHEIVSNSIRFRWRDVREQLRKRLDADAVCEDWRNR